MQSAALFKTFNSRGKTGPIFEGHGEVSPQPSRVNRVHNNLVHLLLLFWCFEEGFH